jgi:hypothetical protein
VFALSPSSSGGICCKVDELVNYIVNVRADLSKYLKYAIIGRINILHIAVHRVSATYIQVLRR